VRRTQLLLVGMLIALASAARVSAQSPLILNEANAVTGESYLGGAKSDTTLGRLQGNGQNWLEFLVVGNDPGKNTLDLRGWKLDWAYQDADLADVDKHGNGVMTFSNDPLWAAVPRGTMITMSEWKEAYYLTNTPAYDDPVGGELENPNGDPLNAGGLQRVGGINGLGNPRNETYNSAIHTLKDFSSNTTWNPLAEAGADWNIHVWAGDRNAQNEFKYFNFTGTVSQPDGDDPDTDPDTFAVGIDDVAGLFSANNDEWRITIKDASDNLKQGPIGEHQAGWTGGGVGSNETLKLEAFEAVNNPTLANYQNVTNALYKDGSSSAFGQANQWNSGENMQDLSPLRSWFATIAPGDVNLDGIVNIFDINQVSANWGPGHGNLGGDANGDGTTNIFDINLISANWSTSGGAQAVPEPAAVGLLLIGASVLMLAGWRRCK